MPAVIIGVGSSEGGKRVDVCRTLCAIGDGYS
jgi:hypothetical protein